MSDTQRTVTVTVVEKPNCKLIVKRGHKAQNYFEFCEEVGCDAFEILETIPGGLDRVASVDLPPCMIVDGTSKSVAALEVAADFDGVIPDGFEVVELPRLLYMSFNGAPYQDEGWFGEAHQELYRAIDNYMPQQYGYEFATDTAPIFNHFASAKTGVRQLLPVRPL